jgi:AcrR family transcriptional regulator
MVRTPWGDADELRGRKLRPGPGIPREEVERNQRERLFGATVAASTTRGYAETSVADLLELSGVSRTTFYRHFGDKEDCFEATLDEILTATVAVTASRLRRDGAAERKRAQHALSAFFELVVAQPDAARLCLVESYAAGPGAVARMEEALAGFQLLVNEALGAKGGEQMPEEMARAIVGGLRKIVHTRLHRGTEGELPALVEDLLALGFSYRPPPVPLRAPQQAPAAGGENHQPADPVERLIRATMSVVAQKGYAATKIADIAAAAGASLSTFYAHFDGKEAAFEAALYDRRSRMLGVALPAYQRARSWPEGVRAIAEAALAYLEAEPDFARLIAVDVYAAGPEALERRDRGIEAAQRFIDDGVAGYATAMKPIWREGIISNLYALVCNRVLAEGAQNLRAMAPLATYMALAPFLGAEEACVVANGGTPRQEAEPPTAAKHS